MTVSAAALDSDVSCWLGCGPHDLATLYRMALLSRIINSIGPMATDTQSLIDRSRCLGCSGSLTQAQMMELALLDLLNEKVIDLVSRGPICGNYGGNEPDFTPVSGCGVAIDTSNGRIWWYFNGAWQ